MNAIERIISVGDASRPTQARKQWIAAAIGAAAGLASSLLGGSQASKAAREAERRQRQQEAEEKAWYNRRYNEDYLDTAAGQNLVRRAKEYAKENWKKAQGAAAVGGGTDAATAIAKEQGNKMVGDTIANIAAADTEKKARVDDKHMQSRAKFAQMDMERANQKAANITAAAQQASNALISAGQAVEGATAAKSAAKAPTAAENNASSSITGTSNSQGVTNTIVDEDVQPYSAYNTYHPAGR